MIAVLSNGKQVIFLQLFLEEAVQHVLGGEVQDDVPLVSVLQFPEPFPQMGGSVGGYPP